VDRRDPHWWQTDVSVPLCVNWTDHFYNTNLSKNNFLLPVAQGNYSQDFYGHYDQTTGVLPVSGTDNVMGVIQFQVRRSTIRIDTVIDYSN
jgi:hypothetical protein